MQGKFALAAKIENCCLLTSELKALGEEIIHDLTRPDKPELRSAAVAEFTHRFEDMRRMLDSLPLRDGAITEELPPAEKAAADECIPALIESLRIFSEVHERIVEAVQQSAEHTRERLSDIRKAKEIFQKFVKKPADEDSRFYDKTG